jgi:peroxiredoxin-like protein
MKPLPHYYEVHLADAPSGYGLLSADGVDDLRVAAPTGFDGPGDAWSPESLLLAAVQSCFLLTLRAVARHSHIDVVDLQVDAVGTVDRRDGVTRFTEIVLRPTLTVAPDFDRDRAMRLLEKSEKGCLVSASLSTPVRIEAQIRYSERPARATA